MSFWKGNKSLKAEQLVPFVEDIDTYKRYGRIKRVVGLMIESQGPESSIGDVCYIHVGNAKQKKVIRAEVVGFKDEYIVLISEQAFNDGFCLATRILSEAIGGADRVI